MKRQRFPVVALSVTLLAASLAPASTASFDEWPTRWQVNANGVTGVLEFSIDGDGSLIGRLLDGYVEGYVSGRHLFIRRTSTDRSEVWEGWLAKPRPGEILSESSLIIAGTISVDEGGRSVVYPWFGRPESPPAPTPEASPAVTAPPPLPATAEPTPTPTPEAPAPRESVEPAPEASAPSEAPVRLTGGPLSGTWKTTTGGPARILQDGSKLSVTLADGSMHSGRMTGASTLVVGLRTGCCNGELESPDVIAWSDGSRWQRED